MSGPVMSLLQTLWWLCMACKIESTFLTMTLETLRDLAPDGLSDPISYYFPPHSLNLSHEASAFHWACQVHF